MTLTFLYQRIWQFAFLVGKACGGVPADSPNCEIGWQILGGCDMALAFLYQRIGKSAFPAGKACGELYQRIARIVRLAGKLLGGCDVALACPYQRNEKKPELAGKYLGVAA